MHMLKNSLHPYISNLVNLQIFVMKSLWKFEDMGGLFKFEMWEACRLFVNDKQQLGNVMEF